MKSTKNSGNNRFLNIYILYYFKSIVLDLTINPV